ncbi:MAG: DUF998 domain-containing protein [Promethearchaeota archaeon]
MKLYEKIYASYFSFIGLIFFVIGLIPAIIVHTDFSFFATHISHLGTPSNGLYVFFNTCWFITGIFMIFFLLGFTYYLKEKGASIKSVWITFIFSFLSAVGILGLSIFNGDQAPDMHLLAEYLFFFTGIIYLFLYAAIERKISDFSKLQVFFNIIVSFFFILYLVMIILDKINPGFAPEFQAFSEWLFLFSDLFWFLENGYYMLKHK